MDPSWAFRSDVRAGSPGDTLSCWIRPGPASGRAFLGFGFSSSDSYNMVCWSLVAASDTGQLILQQNFFSLRDTDVLAVDQVWQPGKWYRMAVQFLTTSSVVCELYDSDGSTLLNSLSYSNLIGLP